MTEELVAIAYEFSPLKANLIRTRLEADGIECFLSGETLTSVVGSFSNAAANWSHPEGNIAIQVRGADAEAARAILQELQEAPVTADGEEWLATGPSPALVLFRLLVVAWLSFAAAVFCAGAINNWWLGGALGVGAFVGLSILAFKKSFKSER